MLAIFRKAFANPPEELKSPAPHHSSQPKLPQQTLQHFLSLHPTNSFSITSGDAAVLAYTINQTLFTAFDDIYCFFIGSLNNLHAQIKQYGLSKNTNEAMFVIEAYRTLRDRGPYPADQVIKDLEGSFAFVVYDSKSGTVFTALGSDGGVKLYWGIAADGSVVICDDLEVMKAGCGKSFAPFPKGCMFHSEGGLVSFEHPMNKIRAMPRVDSEGVMCGANFKVDPCSRIVMETWGNSGKCLNEYRLYTGALGTAFLVFKAYQITHDKNDLNLCKDILKACDSAPFDSSRVTFICGLGGVYALGAVVAKEANDDSLCDYYLTRFRKIKISKDLPDELLYGRSGYLWPCLFLNKNLGQNTISSTHMRTITDEIIESGRKLSTKECPLMYEWRGERYWGAAHGLVGIMHVLLDMVLTEDEIGDVKGTLFYMMKNRFPSGNYPSSEGSESDDLVHWCHGAAGVALTLAKAAKACIPVFGDEEFYKAAVEAGEVVWERGLLKRVGICHGISGNTYVFLSLYRLTGDVKFLYRAKAFATFLNEKSAMLVSQGTMHGGDHPFSLFEGVGGMAYLFMDMIEPLEARFPAYEL
ncbi:hypothetical protein L1987_79952 [Smallanthus sonchifolius]|uniref:Uncharacterized protein n=1 Tax=Smallanthus sonchifolius TaxID=185202 RepID=A0ACB8YLI3_9ASTR|nr:hypothetical protein L1987_79952 [Smallanthus sonchifolius]